MSSRDTETAMQDVALKQEEGDDSTDMEPVEESKSNKTPLNAKNYLNVSAYLLNTIFTYGVGTAGWFGAGDTGDISDKYQVSASFQGVLNDTSTHTKRHIHLPCIYCL